MQKCVGKYQLPTRVSEEEEGAAGRGQGWPGKAGSGQDLDSCTLQETEKAKGFPGLRDTSWQVI